MTHTVLDLFSLVMICQFFFLIIAIRLIPNTNISANKILQLILSIFCFFLIERLVVLALIPRIDEVHILRYGYTPNFLYYILGPLIYMYIRRLLVDDLKPYFLPLLHFVPAFLFFLITLLRIFMPNEFISNEFNIYLFGLIWETSSVVSIVFYLFKSHRLLKEISKNEKQNLSYDQAVLKYVKIKLIILLLAMVVWFANIILGYFFDYWQFVNLSLMWVLFGIQAYITAFFTIKQPQIFKFRLKDTQGTKTDKKRLSQIEISSLRESLDNFINREKAYRRSEISLAIMANEINSSSNNLSWLLNNVYKQSFYDFINRYRIKEFLERVQKNHHKDLTLIAIAREVGFKSKSTFYKAFKDITKQTPSEYIKSISTSKDVKS